MNKVYIVSHEDDFWPESVCSTLDGAIEFCRINVYGKSDKFEVEQKSETWWAFHSLNPRYGLEIIAFDVDVVEVKV